MSMIFHVPMRYLLWRVAGAVFVALAWLVLPAAAQSTPPDYWEQTPLPQTGLATFYAPGLMEDVTGYRQAQAEISSCSECVGTVALLRAGDIGRKVWLRPPESEPVGPFLVVDCARQQDVAPLLARNWAVDVSYELGQLWGMTRPLAGITVLEDPADAAPGAPFRQPTPFRAPDGEVVITAPTATPAVPPSAPTPWPTRLPQPLAGGVGPQPTVAPLPTVTRGPTPLTPVVTTPTPRPGPTVMVAPDATAAPPDLPAQEVSLGHAGAILLDPVATPVSQLPTWPTVTITPRAPTRTPRPDLTPILPVLTAGPGPTPTPTPGIFSRWWQGFVEAIWPGD